jgi:outer membrane lipoprotein carrier protein
MVEVRLLRQVVCALCMLALWPALPATVQAQITAKTSAESRAQSNPQAGNSKSATRLDEFLAGLQSLKADFRQVLRDGRGRVIEESQGTLAIHRPNRFRWDYKTPHPQTIVADGKRLWVHDVDLEQVTVRPLEQSLAGTPAVLLSGSDLSDGFSVERVANKGQTASISLLPKRPDTDFKRVRIEFADKQLTKMELFDKLGQSTLLEFSGVERNTDIADSVFTFTPPAGVDVIGGTDSVQQ